MFIRTRTLVPVAVIAVVFGVAFYFAWLSGVHNRPEVIAEQREQELQEIRDSLQDWPYLSAADKQEALPTLARAWKYPSTELRWQVALALGHGGPPAVAPLLEALKSKDDEVRLYAVWALGLLGPDAEPALPVVVQHLKDPSAEVREKATFAVGRIAPNAGAAVPQLVAAFDDADESVRQGSSRAVARFGRSAVAPLQSALKQPALTVRRQAVVTLGLIGPDAAGVVPDLIVLLRAATSGLQDETAEALIGIGAPALTALAELLQQEPDSAIRKRAILALGKAGQPAVPLLAKVLDDKDASVRLQAVTALGRIGTPAAAPLIAAGQDDDPEVRQEVVRVLGTLQPDQPGVVSALVKALKDPVDAVRGQAVASLRALNPDPAALLVELKPILEDKNVQVRLDAIRYLVELGPAAVPRLAAMLKDPDASVRKEVIRTLEEISAPANVLYPALLPILKEENPLAREQAVNIFWRCGPLALPHLIAAFKDPAAPVRVAAVWSLHRLNSNAEPVLGAFVGALDDDNPVVRRNAAAALGRYGTPALPHLKKALEDKDPTVRQGTVLALQQLKASPKEVLPLVAQARRDEQAQVRTAAATVLGSLGTSALPHLLALLEDQDEAVWKETIQALKKIEIKAPVLAKALNEAVRHERYSVRRGAAYVLSRCGPDGVEPLVAALGDKDERVRWEAADSLRVLAADAEKAVAPLAGSATGDTDLKVRKVAVAALLTIHGLDRFRDDPAKAVPALLNSLQSASVQTRYEAAVILGVVGTAQAKSVVPALTKSLEDREERVRTAAAAALARINK